MKLTMELLTIGTMALCAAALPAQPGREAPNDEKARLARAVALEELEHDHGAAIEAYRAIAEGARDAEVRTHARLRLGLALRAIGKSDEAEQALRAAAEGEGEAAQQARAALQEPQGQDVIEAQVEAGLEELRGASEGRDAAADKLVWLGPAAVPHLLERAKSSGPGWLDVYVYRVVLRIGGPRVADWVEEVARASDPDVALLRAFDPEQVTDNAVRQAFAGFLDHPDPDVRLMAILHLFRVFPAADIIARVGDKSPGVRAQALRVIGEHWPALQHTAGTAASAARLLPYLDQGLASLDADIGQHVIKLLQNPDVLALSGGRELFLRALPRPAFAGAHLPGGVWNVGPVEHVDEVVAVARALGPVRIVPAMGRVEATPQQRLFCGFVVACLQSWDRQVSAGVVTLVALDYGYVLTDLTGWLGRNGLTDAAVAPLVAWVRNDLLPRLRGSDGNWRATNQQYLQSTCYALARHGGEVVVAPLIEFAHEPLAYPGVVNALLWANSEDNTAALKTALVLEVDGPEVAVARDRVFAKLLQMGIEDGDYARAYVLGLSGSGSRGLQALMATRSLSASAMAHIVDRCLATGLDAPWKDVYAVVRSNRAWVSTLASVLSRRIEEGEQHLAEDEFLDLLRRLVSQGWGESYHQPLVLRTLATPERGHLVLSWLQNAVGPDPAIAEALIPYLDHPQPQSVQAALEALAKIGGPAQFQHVQPLLAHETASVRAAAAETLVALAPDEAATAIATLARDVDPLVRKTFCNLAGAMVRRDLVPALLALLRDPVAYVREAAAQALEAIRFHDEQSRHWQRIGAASGLDATSAAEALIRKVREGTREIKLAAIASLGALGVPETQPFLLELVEHDDPEIAAAARAALQQIQRAAAAK